MSVNRLRSQPLEVPAVRKPNFRERLLLCKCILQCFIKLRNNIEKTEYIVLIQLYGDCLKPGFYLEHFEECGYVLPPLKTLEPLPEGSLGKSYFNYMSQFFGKGNANMAYYERLALQIESPEGLALRTQFADQRREHRFAVTAFQHDFYHLLTGLSTDRVDELCLQAFTYGQIRNGGNFALILFGVLSRIKRFDFSGARSILQSIQLGKQTKPLSIIDWDAVWEQPLSTVRADLCIESKNLKQHS